MKVLGIIPARGGSKGIPKKNIMPICGKPLIAWTIQAARESGELDHCIVSTDDVEISAIAKEYGADVPFLRPPEYATDMSRDIEFVTHAVQWCRDHLRWYPQYIVILQPTSPVRPAGLIDAVTQRAKVSRADSVQTMIQPRHCNPFKMYIGLSEGAVPLSRFISAFGCQEAHIPRQLMPKYYLPVGLVYVTGGKCIDQGNLWGNHTEVHIIDEELAVDINTLEDIPYAEKMIGNVMSYLP